jgi:hypothetical protein
MHQIFCNQIIVQTLVDKGNSAECHNCCMLLLLQMLLATAVQGQLCLRRQAGLRVGVAVLQPALQAWTQQLQQQPAVECLWWGIRAHQVEGLRQNMQGGVRCCVLLLVLLFVQCS